MSSDTSWRTFRSPATRACGPTSTSTTLARRSIGRSLNGAEPATAPYPEGNLTVATFRDPAGNEIGIWQLDGGPSQQGAGA